MVAAVEGYRESYLIIELDNFTILLKGPHLPNAIVLRLHEYKTDVGIDTGNGGHREFWSSC